MANEKYFLQMSECKWPDHVFISKKKTFKICIYHKDAKKQHPSLYCVTNDKEAYPISIELLNSKNKVIRESKKLWSIISASTDFKIKHSYCEFAIQFDSLPPYYDQPLRFRFKATSNNAKIPIIEPFTTRPFRVVRYQLRITSQPPCTFYKDDGGMRNNHMTVKVQLLNPLKNGNSAKKHKMSVPLHCKLVTEDGKQIKGTMKKKGHHSDDKQKSRPPLHYLQLHEDCMSPKISSVSGECIVKFRINDVSQNHKNQGFHVVIQPNIEKLPHLCEIYECRSTKIIVKSKSPEKLNSQSTSKKRRSNRGRSKKDDTSYNSHHHHNNHESSTRSKGKKKRKKHKLKRKHNEEEDDDDEYKPEQTDNSDLDHIDNIHHHNGVKMECDSAINIANRLRKRRKLNGKQYICTNGVKSMKPKTFNVPPNHHWFPISLHNNDPHEKDKRAKNNDNGPESEIQKFAQNCFEMLQFREWICIGYQTEYIDDELLHNDDDDDGDKLQIVRCLLCDAEGIWSHIKPPRHKKGCDFVKLKRSYHQMQLGLIPNQASSSYSNPNPNPNPMPFYNHNNNEMSNLPPLPQAHSKQHNHHRFIPPAFPPPFFNNAAIPPMFPPYHQIQPPPLIQASSSNTTDTKTEKCHKLKNGKHKIKTQSSDKQLQNEEKKSSPLMFPFGHQSPQMFPTSVGPMQSPLFSINNVPQTPQLFTQPPLSANGPNNGNGPNMFTLPPGPNPNGSNLQTNHHLSINTHSLSYTASTLPMPLQLPITMNENNDNNNNNGDSNGGADNKDNNDNDDNANDNIKNKKSKHDNDHKKSITSRASSICNTAAATMGSPTATIRSNPPQSKSSSNLNTNTPNTNNQIAVSVDSAISRLSQSESLSAVATAGGLTINTPFAETASLSINTNHKQKDNRNDNNKEEGNDNKEDKKEDNKSNKNTSQMIAAHAPPLLPRYIISPPHILHQNSSNNSIETQIGSMPPLHPDTTNKSQSPASPATTTNDKPLHQRRLMENAPTTLTIPSVTSSAAPFANIS